ncbi:MAG: epoxyqueuosine reductase QueH [Clostridiales Family XIII bacterium]|jgi:predicted adenine nucleotide alpha hydrolase (AANH) superfamily ATPase|nr:epoxyqueuosine reductase QueH [Clostridiales Family XIII bacterium]
MKIEKRASNIENATIGQEGGGYSIGCFQGSNEELPAMPQLLLHSCCGPCSTAVIERLAKRYRITVFFYNPNIYDRDEYERRRDAQIKFIDRFNAQAGAEERVALMEGAYEPEVFEQAAAGLEGEPEGGLRCSVCFRLRLEKAAEAAIMAGCGTFATTLSVSPHKNHALICRLGNEISVRYGIGFLPDDFKKGGGYGRSVELAAKYGLYRQSYCGCRFALAMMGRQGAVAAGVGGVRDKP